ncbi:MAG: hypothetical protein WBP76_01795 [Leptotrichiaceae bacterium]|nr:hypothetical protein [Leptotrichiaceae bacterium]MBP6167791.1 hypothetical protein [Leptotrichiaceae bacterium]MBP7026275.1 hypothetical protein [Leptotrichiaceae bacterium]MBP8637158.1 hypothetical protein [Leptotrichiaceae bacterium]MBP9875935.1 hypothetical protein [Leptotrichiaceae bacterium]
MKLESFLTFVKGSRIDSIVDKPETVAKKTEKVRYITINDFTSLDGEEKYISLNKKHSLAEEEDILLNLQSQKTYRGIRGVYAHNFLKVLIDYNQMIDLFAAKKIDSEFVNARTLKSFFYHYFNSKAFENQYLASSLAQKIDFESIMIRKPYDRLIEIINKINLNEDSFANISNIEELNTVEKEIHDTKREIIRLNLEIASLFDSITSKEGNPESGKVKVGDIFTFAEEEVLESEDQKNKRVPFVQSYSFAGNNTVKSNKLTSDIELRSNRVFKFVEDDLLFSTYNKPLKSLAIAEFEGYTGYGVFVIKEFNKNIVNREFTIYLLKTDYFHNIISKFYKGRERRSIDIDDFKKVTFYIPSYEKQLKFSETYNKNIMERIHLTRKLNKLEKQYNDSLTQIFI